MASLAIPLILAGISGVAGILNNRPRTTTTNINQRTQGTSGSQSYGTSESSPNYDPQTQALRDQLIQAFGGRLGADATGLVDSIISQNASNINRGSALTRSLIQSNLASRGLGYSPAGTAANNQYEADRVSQQIQNQNSRLPLLDQIIQQRLDAAKGFLASLPVGTRGNTFSSTTGYNDSTTTGTQTSTGTGNEAGGGLSSLASVLGGLYGAGAFGQIGQKGIVDNVNIPVQVPSGIVQQYPTYSPQYTPPIVGSSNPYYSTSNPASSLNPIGYQINQPTTAQQGINTGNPFLQPGYPWFNGGRR